MRCRVASVPRESGTTPSHVLDGYCGDYSSVRPHYYRASG